MASDLLAQDQYRLQKILQVGSSFTLRPYHVTLQKPEGCGFPLGLSVLSVSVPTICISTLPVTFVSSI